MEEFIKPSSAAPSLSFREKLLVAQKTFRLMTSNVFGLVADALTPLGIEDGEGTLADITERVEIRSDASAIHMSRYILHNEIGPEDFREGIETDFTEQLS